MLGASVSPADQVMCVTPEDDEAAYARTFRIETAGIRNLTEECLRAGIALEGLPDELGRIRSLLQDEQLGAALERIREIKLGLLAEILLQGPDVLWPAAVENTLPGPLPDEVLSEIDARLARGASTTQRPKPPS